MSNLHAKAGAGVLCIGSLNLDISVHGSVPPVAVEMISAPFKQYGEMPVTDIELAEMLKYTRHLNLPSETRLGGSAFNVLETLRAADPGMRLGFVGIVDSRGGKGSHKERLSQLDVEVHSAAHLPHTPARALAFLGDGDRTLFTSSGPAQHVGPHLEKMGDRLSHYISTFAIVHVSSFHPGAAIDVLAHTLTSAIALNPELRLSVDPGDLWSRHPTPAALSVVRSASIMTGSRTELAGLGGRLASEGLDSVLPRLDALMRPGATHHIVLKSHDTTVLYSRVPAEAPQVYELPTYRVPAASVTNATGAGDTLVAGILSFFGAPPWLLIPALAYGQGLAQIRVKSGAPPTESAASEVLLQQYFGSVQVDGT